MTVRKRILILIVLVVTAGATTLYFAGQRVLLRGFEKVERQQTVDSVALVVDILRVRLDALYRTADYWAAWDQTYAFMQDLNEGYTRSNITLNSLESNDINLMLFLNDAGKIVASKAFDLETGEEGAVPEGLKPQLLPGKPLVSGGAEGVSGMINIPEGAMLVAAHPIAKGKGPSNGTLVFARYIDGTILASISESSHLKVDMQPIASGQLPQDFRDALSIVSMDDQAYVRFLNDETAAGYTVLKDIYGDQAVVLRADMERNVYRQSKATLWQLALVLLLVGVLSGFLGFLAIERGITGTMVQLSRSVRRIAAHGDGGRRIPVKGQDELSRLGASINEALDSLQQAQVMRERAEQETEERQRLEALHKVSQAVAGSLELEQLAAQALDAMLGVLGLEAGIARYLDENSQELVLLAYKGLPEDFADEIRKVPRIKMGESLAGRVAQSGIVLALDELPADALAMFPSAATVGYNWYVGLPLMVKQKAVGVISAFSRTRRSLSQGEMDTLTSAGSMVGMAIYNARLFQRVEAGKKEWEKTFDYMSDGVSILSNDHRFLRANWAMARMLGTTPGALVGRHCYEMLHGTRAPVDGCLLSRCLVEKHRCEAVRREAHLGNRWLHLCADPVLGEEGDVLSIIYSVRDITAERRHQEDLERIHRLSRVLSSSLDLQKVMDLALVEVVHAFGETRVAAGIALLDQWRQHVTVVAHKGERAAEEVKGLVVPLSALPKEALSNLGEGRKAWLLPDIREAPQVLRDITGISGYRTAILLPLVAPERTMGVLYVISMALDLPGKEDVALLETYAREIALAVQNAELYTSTDAALRHRVAELEALTSVLSAGTRSLDIQVVFREVLARASEALGMEQAALVLAGGQPGQFTVLASYRRGGEIPPVAAGTVVDAGMVSAGQQTLAKGLPLVIEDTRTLEGGDKLFANLWSSKSALVVPMMAAGRSLGTVSFTMTSRRRSFLREDISLAQAIGNHMASIVENVRLHDATARERSTLEAIFASMAEGLVVADARNTVIYCNRAAEELVGLNASDIVGHNIDVYYDLLSSRIVEPEGWREKLSEEFRKMNSKQKMGLVLRMPERRDLEAVLFSIRSDDRHLGIGMVLHDVTRERETERVKAEFISTVSHELRTPMTAVYGFVELLLVRSNELAAEHRNWLEAIHRESKRLTSILDDLLDVSRIEAGRLSLKKEAVQIGSVASEVLAQFTGRGTKHTFAIDVPEGFPDVLAEGARLHQILYNLVDNAVKYSPKGGPVRVQVHLDETGDVAVISVSDRGLGVPREEIPNLFKRFQRIQRPETVGLRGTGLGLHIVKSLVEMMGGEVWVKSEVDQGSTFYFSLPLAKVPA